MQHEADPLSQLVVLLGHPVQGNPTEYLMTAAFGAARLTDWRYLSIDVAPGALADAVRGLHGFGIRGAHVTVPYKVAILEHLDELTPAAAAIGAVNCILRNGSKLVGHNTDGAGFVAALSRRRPIDGTQIVVLGAGGAARAIAVEMAMANAAHVEVVNRTLTSAQLLADDLHRLTGISTSAAALTDGYLPAGAVDVMVQATSAGLGDLSRGLTIDLAGLASGAIVADVIPNPPQTALLSAARSRGLEILTGTEMLVAQAELAFRWWTGLEADAAIMGRAVADFFEGAQPR